MNILITGVTGFIGSALLSLFKLNSSADDRVIGSVRRCSVIADEMLSDHIILDVENVTAEHLVGFDLIIHCAGRAHVIGEPFEIGKTEHQRINSEGTRNLARAASAAGVKRFVYISTAKVNLLDVNQTDADNDPYTESKRAAELMLKQICSESTMDWVIIRPPLVYGVGVKGNFETLVKAVRSGWPLPVRGLTSSRSMVGLDNLLDLIRASSFHPAAVGEILQVSDGEDVTVSDVVGEISAALGCPDRRFWVPKSLLKISTWLVGREGWFKRLTQSFTVDISQTQAKLGWRPPHTFKNQIGKALNL